MSSMTLKLNRKPKDKNKSPNGIVYRIEDVRLRALWTSKVWRETASISDRARLLFIDEWGSAMVIAAWVDGKVRFRTLWMVVSDYAGDFEQQEKLLTRD